MSRQRLELKITGDSSSFRNSIKQSEKSVNGFQSKLKGVASTIKLVFVGALAAGGVQALRSAKQFDKSMTQIKSLVGIASAEVDKMGETAIKMATKTGRGANEAAEALFFITSAGLRGSEAMEVLEASLKAAAVGLGETKTVADLATSALNAYGSANLSATDATDVMVTAVREGKLEAGELAQSMGRVLPLASAMGVEFHEVGAAFAALSRTGTNAAEASTQIRGIFASLLKPTQQAEEALDKMSLSSAELRTQLREKGLLSTLQTLKKEFEGNDEAAAQVFGNVRALSAVLDLMGENADGTRKIFDNLTQSVNATNDAFIITEESTSQKLDKALAQLGNSTIPVAESALLGLVNATNGLITAFKGLGKIAPRELDNIQRSIDRNKKSMEGFTKSGLDASKAMKGLFSSQALFGKDIDKPKQKDLLLNNILTFDGDEESLDIIKELGLNFMTLRDSMSRIGFDVSEIIPKKSVETSDDLISNVNDLKTGFTDLNTLVLTGVDLTTIFANASEASKKVILELQKNIKFSQQLATVTNIVTTGFNLMFDVMSNPEGFNSFLKSIKRVIVQLLKQLAIMVAIASIMSIVGGSSIKFKDIFKKLLGFGGKNKNDDIPLLANGGIITSPTLAMIGEGGQSEAVIPLNKLPQMMGATSAKGKGEFTLRGQDLILALERASDFRARITG